MLQKEFSNQESPTFMAFYDYYINIMILISQSSFFSYVWMLVDKFNMNYNIIEHQIYQL